MCSTGIDVLRSSSWSHSSFLFKMLMAGSVGIDVNSAETSNEETHSPSRSWIPWI